MLTKHAKIKIASFASETDLEGLNIIRMTKKMKVEIKFQSLSLRTIKDETIDK